MQSEHFFFLTQLKWGHLFYKFFFHLYMIRIVDDAGRTTYVKKIFSVHAIGNISKIKKGHLKDIHSQPSKIDGDAFLNSHSNHCFTIRNLQANWKKFFRFLKKIWTFHGNYFFWHMFLCCSQIPRMNWISNVNYLPSIWIKFNSNYLKRKPSIH